MSNPFKDLLEAENQQLPAPPTDSDLFGEAPRFDDSTPPCLLCPFCSHHCTHHGEVIINTRFSEDNPGRRVVVPNGSEMVEIYKNTGGFAGRRSDLTVNFWCENCHGRFALSIMQHKGSTFIEYAPPHPGACAGMDP